MGWLAPSLGNAGCCFLRLAGYAGPCYGRWDRSTGQSLASTPAAGEQANAFALRLNKRGTPCISIRGRFTFVTRGHQGPKCTMSPFSMTHGRRGEAPMKPARFARLVLMVWVASSFCNQPLVAGDKSTKKKGDL